MKRKNPLRELLIDLQAEARDQKDVDPRRALLIAGFRRLKAWKKLARPR